LRKTRLRLLSVALLRLPVTRLLLLSGLAVTARLLRLLILLLRLPRLLILRLPRLLTGLLILRLLRLLLISRLGRLLWILRLLRGIARLRSPVLRLLWLLLWVARLLLLRVTRLLLLRLLRVTLLRGARRVARRVSAIRVVVVHEQSPWFECGPSIADF